MDALVQFFTTVAVAMTATALSHMGVENDKRDRSERGQSERSIKRTPVTPQAAISVRLPR